MKFYYQEFRKMIILSIISVLILIIIAILIVKYIRKHKNKKNNKKINKENKENEMIYQFMKRPAEEGDNPLLKFTKYQRKVLSSMTKMYGAGEPIADYLNEFRNLCLNDINKTAIEMTKKEGKTFLSFGRNTEPFAEVTTSGKNGQLCTLVKWLDFFDYMGEINYNADDDNLPDFDVLTEQERNWYQEFRLQRRTDTNNEVVCEYFNNKPIIYGPKSFYDYKEVYLGVTETKGYERYIFLALDPEFKKIILYISLITPEYTSPFTGRVGLGYKIGRYLDPVVYKNSNIKPYLRYTEEEKKLIDNMKETLQWNSIFARIINSTSFPCIYTENGKNYEFYGSINNPTKADRSKTVLLYLDKLRIKPFVTAVLRYVDDKNFNLALDRWLV